MEKYVDYLNVYANRRTDIKTAKDCVNQLQKRAFSDVKITPKLTLTSRKM